MNKWQVNIKIYQVNIKIWQDDLKIWQVNIIIWCTSDGRSMPPYLLSLMIDTHKKDTKQISLGKQICKQPDFLANGADLIDRRETWLTK